MIDWVSINTRPPFVLLIIDGATQYTAYELYGDDVADWFEPYYSEGAGVDKLFYNKADYWVYIDSLPKPEEQL